MSDTTTATAIRSAATVALVTVPLYILRRPLTLATTLLVAGAFMTPFRADFMEMYRDHSARSETSETRRLESQERLETLRLQNEATRVRLEAEREAERIRAQQATAQATAEAVARQAEQQRQAAARAARQAEQLRQSAAKEAAAKEARATEQSLASALYYIVADSGAFNAMTSVATTTVDSAGRPRIGPFTHASFKDQTSMLHRVRAELYNRNVPTTIVRQQLQQP